MAFWSAKLEQKPIVTNFKLWILKFLLQPQLVLSMLFGQSIHSSWTLFLSSTGRPCYFPPNFQVHLGLFNSSEMSLEEQDSPLKTLLDFPVTTAKYLSSLNLTLLLLLKKTCYSLSILSSCVWSHPSFPGTSVKLSFFFFLCVGFLLLGNAYISHQRTSQVPAPSHSLQSQFSWTNHLYSVFPPHSLLNYSVKWCSSFHLFLETSLLKVTAPSSVICFCFPVNRTSPHFTEKKTASENNMPQVLGSGFKPHSL